MYKTSQIVMALVATLAPKNTFTTNLALFSLFDEYAVRYKMSPHGKAWSDRVYKFQDESCIYFDTITSQWLEGWPGDGLSSIDLTV